MKSIQTRPVLSKQTSVKKKSVTAKIIYIKYYMMQCK